MEGWGGGLTQELDPVRLLSAQYNWLPSGHLEASSDSCSTETERVGVACE